MYTKSQVGVLAFHSVEDLDDYNISTFISYYMNQEDEANS